LYYDMATVTAVKCFLVLAPVLGNNKLPTNFLR
jgi:hypothetical protein